MHPNLVVILIDDLRFDEFGVGGHPYMQTPHIDRLAHEGALFTQAFHTTPLCSPNRAAILTGQYASRHGIIDNVGRDAASHRLPNYTQVVQQRGYETAHIGKWHMGNDASPRPGYDTWISFPGQGRGATELPDPAAWRRALPPLPRTRAVRPGQQRGPEGWPGVLEGPGQFFDRHAVATQAPPVRRHASEGGNEGVPRAHAVQQARFLAWRACSRCATRGFTPWQRTGPWQLRVRCAVSVHHPVRLLPTVRAFGTLRGPTMPAADSSPGSRAAYAALRHLLWHAACRGTGEASRGKLSSRPG